MTNITRSVQRALDADSALRKDLARGIINRRALAGYLRKRARIAGSEDAILSAIRRYEAEMEGQDRFALAGGLIKEGKLSTRTGIAIVAMIKDASVQAHLPKLFSLIHYDRGEVLRIVQAEESIKAIVDEKNVPKIIELVGAGKVLRTERHLAEITMKLTGQSAKVPGVLAILNTELASANINIVESISCVPELLWFIDQKELLVAHRTFMELIGSLNS